MTTPTAPNPTFLTIPLEIRLQIYSYLLTLTRLPIYADKLPSSRPLIYPAILRVNRQTNHEATPALYRDNAFTLYQDTYNLADFYTSPPPAAPPPLPREEPFVELAKLGNQPPRCAPSCAPSSACRLRLRDSMKGSIPLSVARTHSLRHFIIHLKTDSLIIASSFSDKIKQEMVDVLTGAESVTLQVVVAGYLESCQTRYLECLEGVRGVRNVEVRGPSTRMEAYLEWLRGVMMRPVGCEVGMFVQNAA